MPHRLAHNFMELGYNKKHKRHNIAVHILEAGFLSLSSTLPGHERSRREVTTIMCLSPCPHSCLQNSHSRASSLLAALSSR